MRKMVKVTMSKFLGDDKRWLTYNFDFKSEEFADKFIDVFERISEEYGYDFKFTRCPEYADNGVYLDAIDIPFESGEMAEIKKYMRIIFDETKKEMGVK